LLPLTVFLDKISHHSSDPSSFSSIDEDTSHWFSFRHGNEWLELAKDDRDSDNSDNNSGATQNGKDDNKMTLQMTFESRSGFNEYVLRN